MTSRVGPRLRTLPVRVPPAAGESLHSWIEALAARYQMTVRELLPALGLPSARASYSLVRWISSERLRTLEWQAALPTGRLDDAVLDRWAGLGLSAPPGQQQPFGRMTLWVKTTGSGFCPRCLENNGGRWALSWYLPWTFACNRHQVLMATECQACGRRPRSGENRFDHIIDPRLCCHANPGAAAGRHGPGLPRCGAPLAGQPARELGPDHPVAAAQQWVDGILAAHAEGRPTVAAGLEVPPQTALAAAAALMRYALIQGGNLAAHPVTHLASGPAAQGLNLAPPRPAGSPAAAYTAVTADPALFGTAAALAADVLAAPSLQGAADTLGWMLAGSGEAGQKSAWPSQLDAAATKSPLIDAIILRHRATGMNPALRLSYRTENAVPRRPAVTGGIPADGEGWPYNPGVLTSVPARLVPQVAWRSVTDRLPRAGNRDTVALAAALSMAVVRYGTYTEWTRIASSLMLPERLGHSIRATWRRLDRAGCLGEILTAVDALAGELAARPPPIDYARRRWVFRALVPVTPSRLRSALREAGLITTKGRVRYTTMMLWETLTGGDVRFAAGHLAPRNAADRMTYASFRGKASSALADYLALEAERLLLRHRIDEPVSWRPEPAGPGGQAWRSPPPDLTRHLSGWTSPSRQGTLRKNARDHTLTVAGLRLPGPLAFIAVLGDRARHVVPPLPSRGSKASGSRGQSAATPSPSRGSGASSALLNQSAQSLRDLAAEVVGGQLSALARAEPARLGSGDLAGDG